MHSSTLEKRDKDGDSEKSKMGAATYYGAIIAVVFLLIAIAIIVRIVYTRKYKKRIPAIDEPTLDVPEHEERLAMHRRGEEAGLPTYRESILLPNNDTVLAATPITAEPFLNRPSTTETLSNRDTQVQTVIEEDLPADETVQPPKYEADPTDLTTLSPATQEMRMSTHSTSTLLLPTRSILEAPDDPPPSISDHSDHRSQTALPSLPRAENPPTNT